MLCARLDDLLGELGVGLLKSRKMYVGPCPVHGGDNPGALNLYPDGDTRPGYWKCNTHGCHSTFKKTILGFVRGVLSRQKFDWGAARTAAEKAQQRTVAWREAVDWCCRFLGTDIGAVRVDYGELEKRQFAAGVAQFTRRPAEAKAGLTRATVRQHLVVPAEYFLRRGYAPEILDRYDVGLYPAPGRPLSDRVAVPVYDQDHRFVVGFTGRSVFEQCAACGRWHPPAKGCPEKGDRLAWAKTSKWYNHEFDKESHLYNLWFARKPIREQGVVVVVEGPGDVWKLEMAGVRCAVAMFGVELSDCQQVLLEMSGAMNVVVLTDTDAAGAGAREQLRRRLGRSFRLHFPELSSHDVGEMTVDQIRQEVLPVLEPIVLRGY
jgi:5S rRNA maturation endonuclease (ribonuclease M5)